MSANGNFVALLVYKVVALAVGLAFAWMGYQLFLKGITAPAGSAEGGLGSGARIKLARVAPGVFFAVLGAAIVVYTVTRILQFQDAGGAVSTLQDTTTVIPISEPQPEPQPHPEPTPQSEPKPQPGSQPGPGDQPQAQPEPQPHHDPGREGQRAKVTLPSRRVTPVPTVLCDTCTAPIHN